MGPMGNMVYVVHYSASNSKRKKCTQSTFFLAHTPTIISDTAGLTKRHLCNPNDCLCMHTAEKRKEHHTNSSIKKGWVFKDCRIRYFQGLHEHSVVKSVTNSFHQCCSYRCKITYGII